MSFISELTFEDLRRLREAVKRQMRIHDWPQQFINDYEADKWIEAQGPEVAAVLVRRAVDSGAAEKKLII